VAAGRTRRSDLRRAAEKLDQVGVTVLGTVLNEVTRQTWYGYGYGYGYGTTCEPYLAEAPEGTSHRGGMAPVPGSSSG